MKKFLIFLFLVLIIFSFNLNSSHSNRVVSKDLMESSTTVRFNELEEKLDSVHYNLVNPDSYIFNTNKFLCTGTTNITCASSSTFDKVGLINLSEYNKIGGRTSYINAKNNYWTMTEEGNAANIITAIGSSLVPKETYAGVRPVVYLQESVKVIGSGVKNDPYVIAPPIDYYVDGTGANYPELARNMIPVRRSGNKWIKADVEKKWYNYANQEWANAVMVKFNGTKTRDYYMSKAAVNKEIAEEDILLYFVWIPRYAYKISSCYHDSCSGYAGVVSVKFLEGKTNVTKDGTQVFEDNASNAHYVKHPAFKFGDEELTGIWVAKFETTGSITGTCTTTSCTTAALTSKPNLPSVRNATISNMFFAIRSMKRGDNEYGFWTDYVDVHMMKAIEWGAMAYLTQSSYGKYGNPMYTGGNKEVYHNKNASFLTGYSNGTPAQTLTLTQCPYDDVVDRKDGSGACGAGASTTGNITGIYDTVGCGYEYVMANFNGNLGASGFSSLPSSAKYYDSYTTYSNAKYGDAVFEVTTGVGGSKGWYYDWSDFISAANPWMSRGGRVSSGNSTAGIFAFISQSGGAQSDYGFRIVVTNH